MKEVFGDIWKYYDGKYNYIGITTNGYVKKETGECVMGRGIALQAKNKFKGIARLLGLMINQFGNHVFLFASEKLFSFPVKHNWWEEADLELIERSCKELQEYIAKKPDNNFFLVRPGTGNGKRPWEEVKPVLDKYFKDEDRLTIVEFTNGNN